MASEPNLITFRRIVARYKLAVFLPDKFWREEKVKLKAILNTEIKNPRDVAYKTHELLDFFEEFGKRLLAFGLPPEPSESIKRRVADIRERVKQVVDAAGHFNDACFYHLGSDKNSAVGVIAGGIGVAALEAYEKSIKTIGQGLKTVWTIDQTQIAALAAKLVKKATPEELTAIVQSETDFSSHVLKVKYDFYNRVKLEAQALKLIKKDKVITNFAEWVDRLKEVIIANFTDASNVEYREFDLHGMKVVIDDSTVSDYDIQKYVKYLIHAYSLLRAKGFKSAWYGTVFIRCHQCGGVNRNTGGGTGGDYHIGPDLVNIYSRPSSFIVELLAHELGHRYWFKQMSQTQRGRFESLIRVRPTPKRPGLEDVYSSPIPEAKVAAALHKINEVDQGVRTLIAEFKRSKLKGTKLLDAFRQKLGTAGMEYWNEMLSAVHSAGASASINPTVKATFDKFLAAIGEAKKPLWNIDTEIPAKANAQPDGVEYHEAYRIARKAWLEEVEALLDEAKSLAIKYVNDAVAAYNAEETARPAKRQKQWDEDYENDKRPVEPVSDYGGSNIDEAFAEVFAHYVMGVDMTQAQAESFKSVLKSASAPDPDLFSEPRYAGRSHAPLRGAETSTRNPV